MPRCVCVCFKVFLKFFAFGFVWGGGGGYLCSSLSVRAGRVGARYCCAGADAGSLLFIIFFVGAPEIGVVFGGAPWMVSGAGRRRVHRGFILNRIHSTIGGEGGIQLYPRGVRCRWQGGGGEGGMWHIRKGRGVGVA